MTARQASAAITCSRRVRHDPLREHLHLSQSALARVLDMGVSTVRKCEVGETRPSGPSQKLLDIIEREELEAFLLTLRR